MTVSKYFRIETPQRLHNALRLYCFMSQKSVRETSAEALTNLLRTFFIKVVVDKKSSQDDRELAESVIQILNNGVKK